MLQVMLYLLIAILAAAIGGGIVGWYNYHQNKMMLSSLNAMLDAAITSTFHETSYDETVLSQIEAKLGRYLSISATTEHHQEQEKERIKMLISDISHQTKTPIANILLYVQLLQEQAAAGEQLGSAESKGLIQQIVSQSEKLSFLIQALIKTSRMEAGIIHVHPQRNPIKPLVELIVAQVEEQAQLKQIDINMQIDASAEAMFDPKWTEEALFNIIDNSIKYTPEYGAVTIQVESYELFTRIDIRDTGIGLSEQDINKIFQRFYRSPQVSQVEGVGIGLYITREIISIQNGYIKVNSEPGKGSTFSVFLPRHSA